MAVDAMRRLSSFRPLPAYRYVGLGGYEFVDFDLVHRALGVNRMTSIESAVDEKRLKFNRPFPGIDLKVGTSNEVASVHSAGLSSHRLARLLLQSAP